MKFLAGCFGVDVLTYAVISHHLDGVLRDWPDVVASRSDDEIARRWWPLFPKRRDEDGSPAAPQPHEPAMLTADSARSKELRERLSVISWAASANSRANRHQRPRLV